MFSQACPNCRASHKQAIVCLARKSRFGFPVWLRFCGQCKWEMVPSRWHVYHQAGTALLIISILLLYFTGHFHLIKPYIAYIFGFLVIWTILSIFSRSLRKGHRQFDPESKEYRPI